MDGWTRQSYPIGTLVYYDALVKHIGGLDETQKFPRLFMLPGAYHCEGGYGPNHFNMVTAINAWVEKEIAPDKIMTSEYSGDDNQLQQLLNSSQTPNNSTAQEIQLSLKESKNETDTVLNDYNQSSGQVMPTGGNPNSISGTVIRTLPVYPYPMIPQFTGNRNVNDATNYLPIPYTNNSYNDFKWLRENMLLPKS